MGQTAGTAVMAEQAGVPLLAASSLKAALDADWDDPAARDQALAQILGLLDQVEAFIAGQAGDEAAAAAVAVAGTAAGLAGPRSALYTMTEASTAAATTASVKTMARIR